MACPAIRTGDEFLIGILAHLDCQALTLGSFGFQSLASPGSSAAIVLTGLLTLFVALYGVRLLFGPADEPANLMDAVLKVGIVLTIALSWPAWRIVAYNVVYYGPPDIAATIMPSTLPDPRVALPQRLQRIDSGMAALTLRGTGRTTGAPIERQGSFNTIALPDETGLGWARPLYLASTVGALGLLRIAGGLLLAIAPLMAGLLLFAFSRSVFIGWLRGLVFVCLGSLGTTVVFAVQIAVMEPWIADALNKRTLGYATPTMPTELLALTLAFAIALGGILFFLARVAFQSSWSLHLPMPQRADRQVFGRAPPGARQSSDRSAQSHAAAISENVSRLVRREEVRTADPGRSRRIEVLDRPPGGVEPPSGRTSIAPLESSPRRGSRRETSSQRSRDKNRD
jgi:type IV secretion system protein VirB6